MTLNPNFKSKIGWGCGIAGSGCLAIVLILVVLVLVYAWLYQPYDLPSEEKLKQGYQAEFQSPPPAGVQVLKGRQIVLFDSGMQYLLLKMTPGEIDRHIAKGFTRVTVTPDAFKDLGQANRPRWWQMPLAGTPEYYQNLSWPPGENWSWGQAFMAVDRSTGTVWLCCEKG